MNYYLYYNRAGDVVGWNATDGTVGASAVRVTKSEYLSAGAAIPVAQPHIYTGIELAQQKITDLELSIIRQGQAATDLELLILGGT